jgi:hypothetical protein
MVCKEEVRKVANIIRSKPSRRWTLSRKFMNSLIELCLILRGYPSTAINFTVKTDEEPTKADRRSK